MAQTLNIQRGYFPAAFNFLDTQLPKLHETEPSIWAAFKRYSNLDEYEARDAVEPSGAPPLIFGSTLGDAVWGQFDPEVPARVELSTNVLQRFETAAGNPEARRFLLAKALHEMCHWGCFRKQVADNDEAGEKFEDEAFGEELNAWWLTVPASEGASPPSIFSNPKMRADECILLLPNGKMKGRLEGAPLDVFSGADVAESLPRGYRNNNPGNIRVSGAGWRGLSDPAEMTDFQAREQSFCVFKEPEWGLRAMAVILRNYKRIYGLTTPRDIIGRWAPAGDNNDVGSYSQAIATALKVEPNAKVDVGDDATLIAMLRAMARHENGIKAPYGDVQFQAALLLV
ncbi:MAG: hypothetical protein R3F08_03805 [Dokdonella sp.]|nr:hypothetical protein [Dokdonella sp.]